MGKKPIGSNVSNVDVGHCIALRNVYVGYL